MSTATPATPTDQHPELQPLPSTLQTLRSLAGASALYLVGDVVGRMAAFLLLPLYTRAMGPEQYGILALTTAVLAVLTIALGLALGSAVTRLNYEADDEDGRRSLYATLALLTAAVATAIAVSLELAGSAGLLDIGDVPYDPYLRLALWTAYASVFLMYVIAVHTTRQEPRRVLALMLTMVVLQVAGGVLLVVVLDEGARGFLLSQLVATGATAFIALAGLVRMVVGRPLRWTWVVPAMAFALPLLPHALSQWVLQLADRFILEAFVTQAELGRYSLGYAVGAISMLFVFAFSRALGPIATERLKDDRTAGQVPRVGSYALTGLAAGCLAVALLGEPFILFATPESFHPAAAIVPWIAMGSIVWGGYTLLSQGSWYSMRTRPIAVATVLAGLVNLALNFWWVQLWGIEGAAAASLAGFLALLGLQAWFAQRAYRIPWEYGRLARLAAILTATVLLTEWLAPSGTVASLAVRLGVLVAVFPAALVAARVVDAAQLRRLLPR